MEKVFSYFLEKITQEVFTPTTDLEYDTKTFFVF